MSNIDKEWITINGTHVDTDPKGNIQSGPAGLKGSKPSGSSSGKKPTESDHKEHWDAMKEARTAMSAARNQKEFHEAQSKYQAHENAFRAAVRSKKSIGKAHNPGNLQNLKASFDKFISEEAAEAGEHNPEGLKRLREAFDGFVTEEAAEKSAQKPKQSMMEKIGKLFASIIKNADEDEIEKTQPSSSNVHVDAPLGSRDDLIALNRKRIARAKQRFIKIKKDESGSRRIAKVGIVCGDQLLMGKRRDNGKWTIPGGHVDHSETMKEGALREVLEETGLTLDPKFIFPATDVQTLIGKDGFPFEVQGWMYRVDQKPSTTMKSDPDQEVEKWQWIPISGGLPKEVSSNLHVPASRDALLQSLGLVQKSATDVDADPDMYPGIDNLEAGILKDALEPEEECDPNTELLMRHQDLIAGTDYEMNNGIMDPYAASQMALVNLESDPDFYRKINVARQGEQLIDNNVDKDAAVDPQPKGFNLDLGSGNAREDGHLGLDVYPYDHGTIPHDLNLGIPFPDGSASRVHMANSYDQMGLDDPKALLSEIHRVLMPGGEFVYEGPDEIYNQPQWASDYPGFVLTQHDDNVNKSDAQPCIRQVFTRIATPDPATANDAEPRTGVLQYDELPTDQLGLMNAIDYSNSDQGSSGQGNRAAGYSSQGALVPAEKECGSASSATASNKLISQRPMFKKTQKGGPGSGPAGGGSGDHQAKLTAAKGRLLAAQHHEAEAKENAKSAPKEKAATAHAEVQRATIARQAHQDEVRYHQQNLSSAQAAQRGENRRPEHMAYKSVEKVLKSGKVVPIMKMNQAKQIVYGVVLEPHTVDSQDDWMEPEEIEKAAHRYLSKSRVIGSIHEKPVNATPVESFIAPQDFDVADGKYGPQTVKKGSWVLGVKINDPAEWEKVCNGEYTGFSVGGMGLRA